MPKATLEIGMNGWTDRRINTDAAAWNHALSVRGNTFCDASGVRRRDSDTENQVLDRK